MIYFIEANGMVKIGYSSNPKRRLQMLATGCPFKCTLIGVMKGLLEDEKEVHARFSHLRERGEWFKFSPEVNSFIAEHAIPLTSTDRDENDHPLSVYLASVGETMSAFAGRVGLSRAQIYRILNGSSTRVSTLKRMSKATGGVVAVEAFIAAEAR